MKRLYILGAGASADFSPISYNRGYPINQRTFIPFPTTNNFIQKAIRFGKLKKDYPIFKFIDERYNITFEALEKGTPLDVERVYRDIYESSERVDMENDPEGTGKAWTLLWTIEGVIQELTQHYFTVYGVCENYSVFAKHIVETDSTVITFNWDTFLDEALSNTSKWFYESGYGFNFERIYLDQEGIDNERKASSAILLKPHGSINWFRYRDHYSSTTDGFTGEAVSDDDRAKTFLMLFSKNKIGIHPIHQRLDMAKGWKPPLKMPCGLDIIYPNKKSRSWVKRTNYLYIRDKMNTLFKEADNIVFIGFALKDPDADEFGGIKVKEAATITLVNLDHSVELTSRYKKTFQTDRVNFAAEKTFKEYCLSLSRRNKSHETSNLHSR